MIAALFVLVMVPLALVTAYAWFDQRDNDRRDR